MLISVGVIAYNEANVLNNILSDIRKQDYDHNLIEVVLADSNSTDSTKSIMLTFANQNANEFYGVQVLDNRRGIQASGWNTIIDNFKGEALIRIDAHAHIPKDFVRKNVELLKSGENICGGQRPCMLVEETPWKNTLLLGENSMFGSSIAPYRGGDESKDSGVSHTANTEPVYMKSLFHACYRREVFEKIGHFNESLKRTEDNEMHYRMRQAGYKFRYSPDIISYQHTRSSLSKMLKQKFGNGFWIGKTLKVCPGCLSLYHFVPFAFVLAIIVSTILCATFGFTGVKAGVIFTLTSLMWCAYWLIAVIMAVIAVVGAPGKRNITCIFLPFIFFLLHISYGIGTLCGLMSKNVHV